jgi:type I restriction enzyme S subunit
MASSPERLAKYLKRVSRPFSPQPGEVYKLLGVRLYGDGVRIHDEVSGDVLKAANLYLVRAGDIIYNKMWASKGAFGVVPTEMDGLAATNEYPTFTTPRGPQGAYIRLLMAQPSFWRRAKAWSNGTTGRARLDARDFLRMPAYVPDPMAAAATVAVISNIERRIEITRALVDRLGCQKRGIMARLLVGDDGRTRPMKDLPERWLFGRVAQGVERIPSDWRLVRLTDVAKLESGHTPSRTRPEWWSGTIPWISLGDAEHLDVPILLETKEHITPDGLANSSARLLPVGTVIFSRTANSWGHTTILGRPMATSQDFANYVCGPLIEPRYVVQVFRHMRREWERFREGSTHKTIYMPVFKQLQVLLPPLDEQRRIADVGEAFDLRIAAELPHLDALRELKRGLADALLSGRLRIPPHLIEALAAGAHDVRE